MTRQAVAATALLSLVMAAHAALESARDAFLLSELPPSALLWSYILIAVLAVIAGRLDQGRRRLGLPLLLGSGSLISLAFFFALPAILPAGAIAFYVFTAIYITIVVPRFWLLLTGWFSVGEAKRSYTWIGLGGIAGAAVGSALSTWLITLTSARGLLLLGASTYLAAAALAATTQQRMPSPRTASSRSQRGEEQRSYVHRLVWAALLASATFTVVDYLFKSNAAATVPQQELAGFFARTYTGVNLVAFAAQLAVAPVILRRLGTHSAAMLLPILLLVTTGSFAVSAWPSLALAAKGADAALRNSLHRTTTELFYFPLPADARDRWKGAADAFGQRGGQAIGAVVLLGLVTFGAGSRAVAMFAAALTLAWLLVIATTRKSYLELFRRGLRRGVAPGTVPVLASDTLQAVLEAFSSPDDAVVCAAIDLLAGSGHDRLVPSVLVHHPSQRVALRALDVLARSKRTDLADIVRPLLEHPNGTVRANALRVSMQAEPKLDAMLRAADDPSPDVQVIALLALLDVASHREMARDRIDAVIAGQDNSSKLALTRASQIESRPELASALARLLDVPSIAVRREALRAMALVPDAAYLPRLQPLLADRPVLSDVRRVIIASSFGDSSVVEGWLADRSLPAAIRRHLPRTLSAFGTDRAAHTLLRELAREPDERVRYKILRGLGRMRADRPTIPLDARVLRHHASVNLERALVLLSYRVALGADARTQLERLLCGLLTNKEERALENVFRVLGILQPQFGLEDVWRSARAADMRAHDAALEVIETLGPALRLRLAPLLRHVSDDARLREAGIAPESAEDALSAMSSDESIPLRELARAVQEARRARR